MKKRFLSFGVITVLILVFAMAVTACGGGNSSSAPETTTVQEISLPGTYHATFDATELLNQQMEEQGIALESTVTADFTLELKEDETFVLSIDGEGFTNSIVNAVRSDGAGLVKNLLISEGLEEDSFESIATLSGYDSFDEFVNAMVDEMASQVEESLGESIESSLEGSGTYEVDGSTLKLKADSGNVLSDDATINSDGSIAISVEESDLKMDLVFTK